MVAYVPRVCATTTQILESKKITAKIEEVYSTHGNKFDAREA